MNKYFIASNYYLCNVSKMEEIVRQEALHFMNWVVSEDKLNQIVEDMKRVQEGALARNPRLKRISISLSENSLIKGHLTLYIGGSTIDIYQVREEWL